MQDDEKYIQILAAGGGGGGGSEARYPSDDPEGAYYRRDRNGVLLPTGAISTVETEILDLVSEGPIEGLVTGYYKYEGTEGNIGYTTATLEKYPEPPELTNARWLRSVYWNKIPLVDSNNKFNFSTIDVNYSKGTPNGNNISYNSELTITKPYGEVLQAPYQTPEGGLVGTSDDYVKVYRILNRACVAVKVNVRIGPFLSNNTSEEEYGDVEKTMVEYTIEYRPVYSDGKQETWSVPVKEKIEGKLTSPYLLSTRVDFSKNTLKSVRTFAGWEIRLTRLTPDSIFSYLQNKTYIDSITEVYGNTYSFPNSALVRSKFDAKYFAQIPERAFFTRLLKVKIPNNYDPIKRTYTGDWDGTFATNKEWTNNPAWCFYDLITNKRYGLGNYISEDYFDKWTLYKIAQYCDVLVPDGKGGLEPRFQCNLILNNKEEAFKVLNDFASIFRAILYYGSGTLFLSQDSAMQPEDAVIQFTNADVENGNFVYSTSPKASRNTVAIVRYNDPTNFFKPAVEMVQDVELIKKYGRRDFELTSFGNTSRGQAIREGRYALYTQNYQSETVSFVAGPQAALLRPGDLIKTYDQYRNYSRLGGRVFSGVDGTIFHLDADLTGYFRGKEQFNFTFTLTTPTYNYEPGLISDLTSADVNSIRNKHKQIKSFNLSNVTTDSSTQKTKLTFAAPFTTSNYEMVENAVWSIDCTGDLLNESEYWKVINVEEKESKYDVLGLKFDFNKFGFVESGVKFNNSALNNPFPRSNLIGNLNLRLGEYNNSNFTINYSFFVQGEQYPNSPVIILVKTGADFTPEEIADYGTATRIIRRETLPAGQTEGSLSFDANNTYYFRAYVIGEDGNLSSDYASVQTGINFLKSVDEVIISSLRSDYNQGAETTQIFFTGADPKFIWQVGYENTNTYPGDIYYRVTIREPSDTNQPHPNIYYQATDLEFAPNQPFSWIFRGDVNRNLSNPFQGPFRKFDVVVEAHNENGDSSAGGNFLNNVNANGFGDSDYSRGLGYDIIYAANSGITDPYLTPQDEDELTSLTNGHFYTQQSITADGSVSILLKTGRYTLPDAQGGYLYHSDSTFVAQDIIDEVPGINTVPFELKGINIFPASINIPVGFDRSVKSKYIAYRLFDSFDYFTFTNPNSLPLSNVLEVVRDAAITGLNNRIARFDTASERGLSPSNIFQNGNDIGIGTTPAAGYFHIGGLLVRMDVDKVGSAADSGEYALINISGVNYYIKLYQ